MKIRLILTIWMFLASLFFLVGGAVYMGLAIDLYSPLSASHAGPATPAFTQSVVESAPNYPTYMGVVAGLSLLAAVYFWRCRRPFETKSFAIAFISAINFFVAGNLHMAFFIGYFVLPKAANAA